MLALGTTTPTTWLYRTVTVKLSLPLRWTRPLLIVLLPGMLCVPPMTSPVRVKLQSTLTSRVVGTGVLHLTLLLRLSWLVPLPTECPPPGPITLIWSLCMPLVGLVVVVPARRLLLVRLLLRSVVSSIPPALTPMLVL
jgi:hypothetical protein